MIIRPATLATSIVAALLLMGCAGGAVTSTPTPTPASTTATPAAGNPTATPALPLNTGSAIPPVVAKVVAAMTARKAEDLASLVAYQQIGCTTAQGAGGPPKCKPGDATGTSYRVFATGACQTEWTEDPLPALKLIAEGAGPLYAAAVTTKPNPDPDPTWPKGDTLIIFGPVDANDVDTYFTLSGDHIVRAQILCDHAAGAEQRLLTASNATTFYIPPTTSARDVAASATPTR